MAREEKRKWYSIAYIICLALFFSNIPLSLFIKNEYIVYGIGILLEVIALIIYFILIKRDNFLHPIREKSYIHPFIFLPTLLICFTNFIVIIINKETINIKQNYTLLFMKIINLFLNVFLEELLFRFLLQYELSLKFSKIKSIFISALIFGGIHLLNISSLSSLPICLLQSVYTFGLGLVLGMIYSYTRNIIYPIILHTLFNLNNDLFATTFFTLDWNNVFFIVNIAISLVVSIYLLYVYKKIKDGDKNAS